MGTRIYKAVGWGLQDLRPEDPRLRWDLFKANEERDWDWFLSFVRDQASDVRSPVYQAARHEYGSRASREVSLFKMACDEGDFIRYGHGPSLGGMVAQDLRGRHDSNLVICGPRRSWQRFNDDLDFTEQVSTVGFGVASVICPSVPPHPYNCDWVRPLEEARGACTRRELPFGFHPEDIEEVEGEVRHLRGPDPKIEGFRPSVPVPVIATLSALEVTEDLPALLNQLRPMVYTYWS